MIRSTLLPALAVFASLNTIAPADANGKNPAYIGTWASQPAQCRVDQSQQNAPLIMRRNGYDQHEAHCSFSNIRKMGATWTVRAACSVEGDKQTHSLTLSVANNRLTMRDEHGPRVLQRCR